MAHAMSRKSLAYCLACLGSISALLSIYALLLQRSEPSRVAGEELEVVERSAGTPSNRHLVVGLLRQQQLSSKRTPATAHDTNKTMTFMPSRPTNTTPLEVSDGPPGAVQVGLPADLRERFPHFMIIGFGKAGTRALYNALRLHPQLVGPQKEERFFSLKFGKGLFKYLSSFPPRPVDGYLIEKSPDYILGRSVPARIKTAAKQAGRSLDDMKFIVITRRPIDRAMSEYIEWSVQRKLSRSPQLPPFDQMVLSDGVLHVEQPFVNASCYEYHIRSWLQKFSERQMCYVDGDAFVTDPLEQIQSLESCMGLEPFFTDQNFVYNKKRGFYCFQKGADTHCLGGAKGRPHPQISVDVRTRLVEYFHHCNAHLSQLTGFEIGY